MATAHRAGARMAATDLATAGNRIAEVTMAFWIMKILATTLGETAGDYISMTLGLGYGVSLIVTFAVLAVALLLQIRSRNYVAPLFWFAIVMTTTAGTEVSDFMDRSLGLGYFGGAAVLSVGLAATLLVWWWREGHLRVDPITTRPVEVLFWVAVLFSNSLGTAFGDYLVDDLGLSYLAGAAVTATVIAVVIFAHYATRLNAVILFWLAFVFTRPFGATFGDFLTKPVADGGLAWPRDVASLVTLGLLVMVLVLSMRRGMATREA